MENRSRHGKRPVRRKTKYRGKRGGDKRERVVLYGKIGLILLLLLTVVLAVKACVSNSKKYKENTDAEVDASKPEIDVQLLDVNDYSRPGYESNRDRKSVV